MFHVSIHGSLDRYFNQAMLPPESCCCNRFPFSGCIALRRLLDDRVLLQALDWERRHDSPPFVVRTKLPAKRDFPRSAVRHLHNWNNSFYCKQNILWITKIVCVIACDLVVWQDFIFRFSHSNSRPCTYFLS